jgi:hypothetical protein
VNDPELIPIQHFPPRHLPTADVWERAREPVDLAPDPARRDWLARALAAVAEGRCPNHGVSLTASAAWCFACEAAYTIENGDTVIALYTWLA